MKYIIYLLIFFLFSCSAENPLSTNPIVNDPDITSILDKDNDINTAIKNGNLLIQKQVTVSKFDSEMYAHDSKLLIKDGIGYCAYYGNDSKSAEGENGQSVRLSVFDINNPTSRKVYDVFKSNSSYNSLKTDANQPCYTPVLFLAEDNKIRVLAKVYEKNVQKYYYRDFSPETETFSDPNVCKLTIPNSKDLLDFNIINVVSSLKFYLGETYKLKSDFMFANSEPVRIDDGYMLGLTVGVLTVDIKTDVGTTFILKTKNFGKTFECVGVPDPRKIVTVYNNQFIEGAFDFWGVGYNQMIIIGRNSLGGILQSFSYDGGKSFDIPFALNDLCGFDSMASKPNFIKLKQGGYLTLWNTRENFGTTNYRTVLDIRYSKNKNLCDSKLKIKIKNEFGCHYPSLFIYENEYYLTYTTDSRRFNKNSTGEIVFVKFKI